MCGLRFLIIVSQEDLLSFVSVGVMVLTFVVRNVFFSSLSLSACRKTKLWSVYCFLFVWFVNCTQCWVFLPPWWTSYLPFFCIQVDLLLFSFSLFNIVNCTFRYIEEFSFLSEVEVFVRSKGLFSDLKDQWKGCIKRTSESLVTETGLAASVL